MRRTWLTASLLLAWPTAGCLSPGEPVLTTRDTQPPSLIASTPDPTNAPTIGATDPITLSFSEPMDPFSLRGGISVVNTTTDEPVTLVISVPPEDPLAGPVETRPDVEYVIQSRPESGAFQANTEYELVLTTALSDTEGNGLASQINIPFRTDP